MKQNSKLIQQGAEAKIFLNEKENLITKDRIPKSYRIPEIDKTIIKRRTKAEKKILEKASKIIPAPNPLPLKEFNKIEMPFIDGKKISQNLDNFPLNEQKKIMKLIGENTAKLHNADIIHGDLTTSNMILVEENSDDEKLNQKEVITSLASSKGRGRSGSSGGALPSKKIFFIDFGLGFISKKTEDKAVDIHLLKQALEAKHFAHWKTLFEEFSKSYEKTLGKEESKKVFERLTAIERRGRYRH
ncbi:MAG: RIO1 family regulatory kinase/ATPase [Candidatus Paceibacterota bacterium]|jgi:TP53 regulating kinase-like protein